MDSINSLNPRYTKVEEEGRVEKFMIYIYGQRGYQDRYRSNSGDRRIQFSGRVQYGQNYRGRPCMNKIIEMTIEEVILEGM